MVLYEWHRNRGLSTFLRAPPPREAPRWVSRCGAGGGDRTRTPLSGHGILSPERLPVPPPRRCWVKHGPASVLLPQSAAHRPTEQGGLMGFMEEGGLEIALPRRVRQAKTSAGAPRFHSGPCTRARPCPGHIRGYQGFPTASQNTHRKTYTDRGYCDCA